MIRPMENTILIAALIVAIGIIAGMILSSRGKIATASSSNNKVKTKNNAGKDIKLVEKLPMEFSKRILLASYAIAIVVIIYTMYIVYMMVVGDYTGDPTSLNTLIMLTLGELAGANSFYFWKAKAENLSKMNSLNNNGQIITEEDIQD
jgi:ABC-type Na+ efflux pump permease subunit